MAPHNYETRGLWARTATIDWCESNYELTYYVAEFWNTLSNLAFIVPQLSQYIALSRHKTIEPAYRRAFLSLALVGIGSLCFHMTLARPMQMFDETSMILVSLHGFYLLYIIKRPDVNRKTLAALLLFYGLIFLSLYVFLVDWPIFHHTTFGLLVYASIVVGHQLKKVHGPYYKFWTVLIIQHLGFGFWLIDKHYCELLTSFRDIYVPAPMKPLFQFHALWHLFMGLGGHIFICGIIRLRAWSKYREEFVINYKWFGCWIVLEKLEEHQSPLAKLDKQRKSHLQEGQSGKRRLIFSDEDNLDEELDLNQNAVRKNCYFTKTPANNFYSVPHLATAKEREE